MSPVEVFGRQLDRVAANGRSFVKMHGLGNDFVIVDGREEAFEPTVEEVVHICDRHRGVGADQLLIIERPKRPEADAFLRILNVDGREVGMCGNATRCIAWLLMTQTGRDRIALETFAGIFECRSSGPMSVAVDLGRPRRNWRDIPLSEPRDTLHISFSQSPLKDGVAMSIGVPHIVFFVPNLRAVDIPSVGRAVQNDRLFAEQVNVGFAEILGLNRIGLQVWERPGILTLACASGACVAVAAARARGLILADQVTVEMPGGVVNVTEGPDGRLTMAGQVEVSYIGIIPMRDL